MKPLTPTPVKPDARVTGRRGNLLQFEARDVTGTHVIEARNVQPATPAGAVATALASRMALPANVPWIIRDGSTGAVLEDERPIGDQLETGAKVVLSPKAHLG
jgi:hypothetical protein